MPDLTDPRAIPGDIAGPGGPHDVGGVVLDTRHAVLLDAVDVTAMDEVDHQKVTGLLLSGRIMRTDDRARVLFVFDPDGAAAIVTELEALMRRSGDAWLDEYRARRGARIADLKTVGAW